jgi:hypothetical protein
MTQHNSPVASKITNPLTKQPTPTKTTVSNEEKPKEPKK